MSEFDYTDDFELFLKSECEKMECYSILHTLESNINKKKSNFINIPIIILTSSIGIITASNIMNQVPYYNFILGGFSIFTSILKSLDSYKNYSKLSETHRLTALSYSKMMKYIQIQLSLERDSRIKAEDILDIIINELDSINLQSPPISQKVIEQFKIMYPMSKYTNHRPAILNGLSEIKINKNTITQFKRTNSYSPNSDEKVINVHEPLTPVNIKKNFNN